jgi:integrase
MKNCGPYAKRIDSVASETGACMNRRARGTGRVFKVGDVWKVRYTLHGRRVQESAGARRQDAVSLLARRLGQIAEGRLSAEAAQLMWAGVEAIILDEHRQHRSYEKVERHARKHLRRFFAGMRAQSITYDRLLAFKRDRLAEGAAPNTVKYELSLLNTGLKIAHRAGQLLTLPPLPAVHVENTRTSFFEHHEFLALAKHLPAAAAAVATFMYWTGWRRNETLTREWRHVDFERGTIVLDPGETKSGDGRTFPFDVLPELERVLRAQRDYTDVVERRTGQIIPFVFHRDGRRVISIRAAWDQACEKAQLGDKIPHDFRRSAVRRLERAGVPRSVAMKLVGHRTEHMYQRYAITNETDLREGLAKVAKMKPSKVVGRIASA